MVLVVVEALDWIGSGTNTNEAIRFYDAWLH